MEKRSKCGITIYYLQIYHDKICLYDASVDKTLYFEKYKKEKKVFYRRSRNQISLYHYFDEDLSNQTIHLLNRFPRNKILDMYKIAKKRYKQYAILETQNAIVCFLCIRWFRVSIISIFPKDIARLIAKSLWDDREKFFKN